MPEAEQSSKQSSKNLKACFMIHFFFCVLFCLLPPSRVNSLSPDGLSLLQIKKVIESDPLQLLSDWKEDDLNPCSWAGVICDPVTLRVVSLNITRDAFYGRARASFNHSDGYCSFFSSLPSVLFQSLESHSLSSNFFPSEIVSSRSAPVCFQNGTAIHSHFGYNGNNRFSCTLTGSLSPAIGNLSQLRTLSMPFHGFYGELPREIAALRFLEVLELTGNSFSGSLPAEFGHLPNLKVLNLAYNFLDGEIPSSLSGCQKMRILNLAGNMLSGNIPLFPGRLPELEHLTLSFNQLGGSIPPELTRTCSDLKYLHLSGNLLTGTIPPELGNCSGLQSLTLFSNFLSGPIPAELGRLSSLQSLDVSRNSLGGVIPPELGNCSQLSVLVLTNLLAVEPCINCFTIDHLDVNPNMDKGEYNYFSGTLPDAISSLPKIRVLWAPRAAFNAALPLSWGGCQSLEVLNLGGNMFTGKIPSELGNCKNLVYLDLSSNDLEGKILEELPIPCMVVFNISGNLFSGNVPSGRGADCPATRLLSPSNILSLSAGDTEFSLYFLTLYCGSVARSLPVWLAPQGIPVVHDLSGNNLTGLAPAPLLGAGLVEKHPAYSLFLSGNEFTGAIPTTIFSLCQDLQAFSVGLSHNLFSGTLPFEGMLGCNSLRYFEASSNNLTGIIPAELGDMRHLTYLDLGMNNLSGRIPPQIGQLQDLKYLVLANNSLVGDIPVELGQLSSLLVLDLSGNALSGAIPEGLVRLSRLTTLMLNNNSLTGGVPGSFTNLTSLGLINLAFNDLSGALPKIGQLESLCFTGNQHLKPCYTGAAAPAPAFQLQETSLSYAATPPTKVVYLEQNHRNLIFIAAITSGCAIVAVLVILGLLFQYTKRKMPNNAVSRTGKKEVVTFGNTNYSHLSYENVVRATANFSVDNLIGNGGFGATYKAELLPGLLVAVKRLALGRFQGIQQFDAEIRTVGRIHHPNLVTLIGYHASESEMFLIYNYLSGGNLESLIHDRERGIITWKVRYKIALDIAQALAYLHDECTPRVLHRDIKPSNILLDNKLNAYLSDFGLARLLAASETHATTDVAGTFGYVAPEYAMTCRVSDKADVYSYGVVFLELLSGKKALDPSFSHCGDGFNIVAWAYQQLKNGQAKQVFASGLWEEGPHSELIDALKLAVTCTVDSLSVRPTMKQVVVRLKSLRLSSSTRFVFS